MAILKSKIGLLKGRIENMTFYVRNGQQVVRTANNFGHRDRKSQAQLDHRLKMKLTTAFLRPIKDFLRASYKSVESSRAYNQASSFHLKNAFVIEDGHPSFDYTKAMVCQGFLATPENAAMQFDPEEKTFTFTWTDNSGQAGANEDDQLVFLIYAPTHSYYFSSIEHKPTFSRNIFCETTASRKDGSFCYKPTPFSQEEYYVYLAFRNVDDSDISNSVCVGKVEVKGN